MEEHTKTELELSEEQLQEITGGCGTCTQLDLLHAIQTEKAALHFEQANLANQIGMTNDEVYHTAKATAHQRIAQAALDGKAILHPNTSILQGKDGKRVSS